MWIINGEPYDPLKYEYFDCECRDMRHVMRFVLDKEDGSLYSELFINTWRPWWSRLAQFARYVLGLERRGDYDSWLLNSTDRDRLRKLLDEADAAEAAYEEERKKAGA